MMTAILRKTMKELLSWGPRIGSRPFENVGEGGREVGQSGGLLHQNLNQPLGKRTPGSEVKPRIRLSACLVGQKD